MKGALVLCGWLALQRRPELQQVALKNTANIVVSQGVTPLLQGNTAGVGSMTKREESTTERTRRVNHSASPSPQVVRCGRRVGDYLRPKQQLRIIQTM